MSHWRPGDVVVDFSSPEGAMAACDLCVTAGAALVSGTTGLDAAEEGRVVATGSERGSADCQQLQPWSAGPSPRLEAALEVLPESWDVEIVERHHRFKVDAPSGTALTLAREVGGTREIPESGFRHGRAGRVGPRPARRDWEFTPCAAAPGSATTPSSLAGAGEWLELRHVAQDRAAFAHGVLAAARFRGQRAGWHVSFGTSRDPGPRNLGPSPSEYLVE